MYKLSMLITQLVSIILSQYILMSQTNLIFWLGSSIFAVFKTVKLTKLPVGDCSKPVISIFVFHLCYLFSPTKNEHRSLISFVLSWSCFGSFSPTEVDPVPPSTSLPSLFLFNKFLTNSLILIFCLFSFLLF